MSAETVKNAVDVTVVTTTFATVMLNLPQIVLVLTGIYTLIRIVVEFPKLVAAVKGWFGK